MAILDKFKPQQAAYTAMKTTGRDPFSVCFDEVVTPSEAVLKGRRIILLGTNNYLGLTFDRECIQDAVAAVRQAGTGTTGSRIANGTYGDHAQLERRLAAFYGCRSAMVFSTGYQANLGILSTVAGRGDTILIDADSHASIYDGCRLGGAEVIRFRHNDPDDLHRRLRRLGDAPGNRLIVVEGIYSMLGDTAPLTEIAAVKREWGASLLVDEAHSLGVLGETGRGLTEEAGVMDDVDFIVGTFSKSLGAVGGFCVSNLPDFDVLRVVCRPYMFTASLPSAVIASVTRALAHVHERPELRERLSRNAHRLYRGLAAEGFVLGPRVSPIVSIRLPSSEVAIAFWNALLDAGIYLNLALPPATPDNAPLLRSSVSAAHSDDQIDAALEAMVGIGRSLGVIAAPARRARDDQRAGVRLGEATWGQPGHGPARVAVTGS
ncbi:pyridoxal phosphate-dependent aminotransferase family protein [Roseospira marina]|uniref:Pyridoxal phosphate-dependent aminotransferase family protein n=1 Tax=Roseospira marina TaxID=140057 RepID=A0A5M6I719_9PROT|nr:pyridoxal phosphate-dependent aminotransferase family protein [Roseospira marina]KAA5604060.1 pyridoxal phosphate-dependent aminotransferase family protein [Roseospira marina]MBB4315855.1 8-amino-7-oxononanoate synthase [Roseospira marina]MBB5089005.1 8-amino-7-oxononanoate synthase [Roseospira marina]